MILKTQVGVKVEKKGKWKYFRNLIRATLLKKKKLRICKAKGKRKTIVFLRHCPAASSSWTREGLAARPQEGV